MFKIFPDARGLALHASQMPGSCPEQLQLGLCRRELGNHLLQVGIEHLVGIEPGLQLSRYLTRRSSHRGMSRKSF